MEIIIGGIVVIVLLTFLYQMSLKNKLTELKQEIAIDARDNIDKQYISLGYVSGKSSNKYKAEIAIIKQAKKLGANAIIGFREQSSTVSNPKLDKGVLNISNDPKFYSVKNEKKTTYYFVGTAIKYV